MSGERVPVAKTYKLWIGGAFVRSEGGKVLPQRDAEGRVLAQVARATRKDVRDAVRAARRAQAGWAGASAFLRGLVLFRVAEMLEGRRATFEAGLARQLGLAPEAARARVSSAIDRVFWYAGWADKLAQALGGANPVASPHFCFTLPEATGVVGVAAPRGAPVLGLVSALLPVLVPGNAAVVVVDEDAPALALELAEVLATSDLPPGVVNLLSGRRAELLPTLAGHRDVDALALFGGEPEELRELEREAAGSVQRVRRFDQPEGGDWTRSDAQGLYWIEPFVEWKTTWHPVGI